MELLQAVNAVLPHLGEHTITRVEGAKHPTVDLILGAIDRHRLSILAEGLWFNESTVILPVNTDGQIDVPQGTIAVYGIACNVELDGERFFDLNTASRYFSTPITVRLVRDVQFNRLPINVALCIAYRAGAEVYVQDYGREGGADSTTELQGLANMNWVQVTQENLRKRKYNSQVRTRRRIVGAVKFR